MIDKSTGELVEQTSYDAYGGVESDYRTARWSQFREDYKFTGKEEDLEAGLVYFGARYYQPNLGRFISPDPLTLHNASGDMNPYAYVSGRTTMATDPMGLCADELSNTGNPCGGDNGVGAAIGGFFSAMVDGAGRFFSDPGGTIRDVGRASMAATFGSAARAGAGPAARGRAVERPSPQEPLGDRLLRMGTDMLVFKVDTMKSQWNYHVERFTRSGCVVGCAELVNRKTGEPLDLRPNVVRNFVTEHFEWNVDNGSLAHTWGNIQGAADEMLVDSVGGSLAVPGGGAPCTCFVAGTPVATGSGLVAIDALRVGDRVLAAGEDASQVRATSVEPQAWVVARLVAPVADDIGSLLRVTLLRPRAWFEALGAHVAGWMPLVVQEFGISTLAWVEGLDPAPAIATGPGRVVLMTTQRVAADVMRLRVPSVGETLDATRGHRLYSADRHQWISLADLRAGEAIQAGTSGAAVSVYGEEDHRTSAMVYNIEVEGAHSYQVGSARLWSHNAGAPCANAGLTVNGREYINSNRVVARASGDPGPFHNFPGSFDREILTNGEQKLSVAFFQQVKPGYGASGVQYTLPGTVNGQAGHFEIGTRLSNSGKVELIMHRFFRPFRP